MSQNQGSQRVRLPLFNQCSYLCVLLAWCLLVSTVYAQDNALKPRAQQLFESSGLQELIAQIPTSTASAFEATLTADQLPERFKHVEPDSIRLAVRNAFTSDTFDKYLVREMEKAMSEASQEHMLEWYESALGSRVKRAEIDNSLLIEQTRFEAYQDKLASAGVETKREQLIFRMDEIIHSTEAAVDMMTDMQMAFNISLSRFLPEEQRFSRTEILELAQQNHAQLMTQYRNQTREVLLFTYQDFNNDELSQLNNTLATVAGQEFVAAINNGIKKGMFASALDLGDELGVLIGDEVRGPGI